MREFCTLNRSSYGAQTNNDCNQEQECFYPHTSTHRRPALNPATPVGIRFDSRLNCRTV
jgi:hypothetical protein